MEMEHEIFHSFRMSRAAIGRPFAGWCRLPPVCWLASVALVALTAWPQVLPRPTGDIQVTVVGIKSNKGPIQFAFYDSKGAFAKGAEGAVRKGTVPVAELKCEFVITNVAFGTYAVMIGQDLNGNGEIDWRLLGTREPHGVSNYTNSLLWYPSFDKAKFPASEPRTKITIKLHGT